MKIASIFIPCPGFKHIINIQMSPDIWHSACVIACGIAAGAEETGRVGRGRVERATTGVEETGLAGGV